MKKTLFATLALATLALVACSSKVSNIEDDGKVITKTLKCTDFNAIDIKGSGDVEYRQGDKYKVELVATKLAMKGVKVDVKGNTLVITRENGGFKTEAGLEMRMARGKYTVRVTSPKLNGVNIMGSGDFEAKTAIDTKYLNASVNGSGDLHFGKVTADNVNITINGSGDAEIKAKCKSTSQFTVNGSGDIDADVTNCNMVTANVNGSGDIDLDLKDCGNINAAVSGSGDIKLQGNAKSISTHGKSVNTTGLKINKQ